MTQKEAKNHLKKGHKITHAYFAKDEFIVRENGLLKDEKGNILQEVEFWNYRQAKAFQEGWLIYKK